MTLRSIFNDLCGMIICPKCHRCIDILKDKLLDTKHGVHLKE